MDEHQFSEREKQVIELLIQGRSNKQIALALGISLRTVEFHLSNIYARLGVSSRTEAALRLREAELRESTGRGLREPAGRVEAESDHNVATPMFRKRIPMNKSLRAGLSILILTSLVFIVSLYTRAKDRAAAQELPPDPATATPSSSEAAPATTTPPLEPAATNAVIPAHTVNGYTAAIESYYVDASHVLLQVRITGGDVTFGDEHFYNRIEHPDLVDVAGNTINTSGGWGPAVDPALYQFEFVPVTLLEGDRFEGQFAFDLVDPTQDSATLAQFRFDLDLPIYPEGRSYPKQRVTANGLEMLLDSVTITPAFTQAYLCFSPPSFAPWTIGSETVLELNGQTAPLHNVNLLFAADLGGDRRAGSEPNWAPPTKAGRCMKIGFPIGSSQPTSLTLTIPELENLDPDVLIRGQLTRDYPGLSARDAYHTYLEEHGRTYKGPWIFHLELRP